MKKIYPLAVLSLCSLLIGCNGIGGKDTIVARIGNESLYAEDLDFVAVQNPKDASYEGSKGEIRKLLYSLAKTSEIEGMSKSYDSAWKVYEPVVSNRLLTIVYTRFHMMNRLGYSDTELKKFFKEHRSEFDSSASYIYSRSEVAERYYLSQNQDSLKSFVRVHLHEKDEPATADLLYIAGDSASITEESFSSAHSVTVVQGREKGVYADSSVIKALFSADSMAEGEIRYFRIKEDTSWVNFALKLQKRTPLVEAKEEDYIKGLENDFIAQKRLSVSRDVKALMDDMGSVVIEEITLKDPHKYYEDNVNKFMTVPGYEVYHVAMKDSAVLAKTMVNVKDLDSFKAVAATISEKAETSENNGFVGQVKKDYALPYGIGLMPTLWTELDGKSVGYITSAIRSGFDSLYHCFYVSAIVPSAPKSFDRVEKQLGNVYANDVNGIDPATVLVSDNGKPVYTKADLMKIFDAEPGIPYNKETHDNIVKMMAQAYAIAEKAKLENVDKSWEFRALVRIARIEFINARYNRDHKTDEPELPQITDNRKKYEYYLGGAALYGDKTYEEALPSIESSLKYTLEMRAKTISDMGTWSKTNVFFYDRSKAFLAPVATPEGFLALADSAAKSQKFIEAISAYNNVIDFFAERDTLFRTAVYNLAQTYSDAQRYDESAKCFEAFLQVWPDAPEAEKAMFSLGFVLNENLKQNDRALVVLEDFQKRFPKSELKESVDWLVDNIKSNGKLADDLMKKIEAEE